MGTTRVVLAVICALVVEVAGFGSSALACGVERWHIKVLSDGVAVSLSPIDTTIETLIGSSRPSVTMNTPRLDSEKQAYRVHAILREFKPEADEDYHLVIVSPSNSTRTMIAEIPSPHCAPTAQLGSKWNSLRTMLDGKFGAPNGKWIKANQTVTVVGVEFWDMPHPVKQNGVAPNNIELHPILALSFGTSGTVTSPTPTPTSAGSTENGLYNTEAEAKAQCGSNEVVWVNTRSKLYHSSTSRWYGKTSKGAYMCRSAADAAGYTFSGE